MVQARRRHDWTIAAQTIANIRAGFGAEDRPEKFLPPDLRPKFVETPPSEW